MRGLSVQETAVLLEMQPDCAVVVCERIRPEGSYWEIEITPPNRPTVTVAAQRGGIRSWKDFSRLLRFLRDVCEDGKLIIVRFADPGNDVRLQMQQSRKEI